MQSQIGWLRWLPGLLTLREYRYILSQTAVRCTRSLRKLTQGNPKHRTVHFLLLRNHSPIPHHPAGLNRAKVRTRHDDRPPIVPVAEASYAEQFFLLR
jgi:hypothetical protein